MRGYRFQKKRIFGHIPIVALFLPEICFVSLISAFSLTLEGITEISTSNVMHPSLLVLARTAAEAV